MNYLITGAYGLIGGNVVKQLKEGINGVSAIDDLSHSCFDPSELEVDVHLAQSLAQVPLCYYSEAIGCPDWIVHLAGPVGPVRVLSDVYEDHSITYRSVVMMREVIRYARSNGSKILFASTSEVYGGLDGRITLSEDDVLRISDRGSRRDEYAVSKLACEKMLMASDIPHIIIRPFNVAGPRQRVDSGFVMPTFIEQALSGESLTVFNRNAIRSFIHVEDCASAIIHLMETKQRGIFNVGVQSNTVAIGHLAGSIIELTRSTSDIVEIDPKEIYGDKYEEAEDKIPDDSKLRLTGWKPNKSVVDVIIDIEKHMQQNLKKTASQI